MSSTKPIPNLSLIPVILAAAALWPAAAWGAGGAGAASHSRGRGAAFAPARIVVAYEAGSAGTLPAISRAADARAGAEALPTEPAWQAAAELPLGAGGLGARPGLLRRAGTMQTRVLRLKPGISVHAALRRLANRRGVLWARPDYMAHLASTGFIPDDPGVSNVAGGWRTLQWNFDGPFGVGAPEAWANLIADGAPGGRGVIVAVLDTGIAYQSRGRFLRSPDFEATQFVKGYDFVANNPYPEDHNGHGTFVAGTIAEATNNGRGLTGLAYGVKIMPVRVLDSGGEGDASTIAKGIRFAVDHGAKVINLSLEFSGEVSAADVPELVSALAYAHAHGVVIVAAAGNEGSTDIPFPARDQFAIAVGASTEHGCLADYSNYGRRIDLVAPGGGADANLAGDPNCRPGGAPGRDVYQQTFTGTSPRVFGFPDGYEGTSMASPVVAATAALVIASGVLGPSPTPAAVRWRLEQTARPLGDATDAADYGHGLLDAAAATAPGGPGALAAKRNRTTTTTTTTTTSTPSTSTSSATGARRGPRRATG
jgi:serine protease